MSGWRSARLQALEERSVAGQASEPVKHQAPGWHRPTRRGERMPAPFAVASGRQARQGGSTSRGRRSLRAWTATRRTQHAPLRPDHSSPRQSTPASQRPSRLARSMSLPRRWASSWLRPSRAMFKSAAAAAVRDPPKNVSTTCRTADLRAVARASMGSYNVPRSIRAMSHVPFLLEDPKEHAHQ